MTQLLLPSVVVGTPTWLCAGDFVAAVQTHDADRSYIYSNNIDQSVLYGLTPGNAPILAVVTVRGQYRTSGAIGTIVGTDPQLQIDLLADGEGISTTTVDIPLSDSYSEFVATLDASAVFSFTFLSVRITSKNFIHAGGIGTPFEGRIRITQLQVELGERQLGFYESLNNTLRSQISLAIPTYYDNIPYGITGQHAKISIQVLEDKLSQLVSGHRASGFLHIDIYTPQGMGDESALELFDSIKALVRGVHVANVWLYQPYVMSRGIRNGFWLHQCKIPFLANAVV